MASKSRTRSATKALSTPRFYATPQASSSTSRTRTEVSKAYLDYLSRKSLALSQIVEEVPPSRCGSPVEGEDGSEYSASRARVDALRIRVEDALGYANWDTADGKWDTVVQLLRVTSAQRTRWLGLARKGKQAESSSGWINAGSEREWAEWEAKWNQEILLKEKVQTWQQAIDEHLPVPIVPASQDHGEANTTAKDTDLAKLQAVRVQHTATLQTISGRETRNSSTLNFPVVKRSSLTVIGKPKPTTGVFKSSDAAAGPSKSAAPVPPTDVPNPPANMLLPVIEDISETSFLPPSFPSQLLTSTPNVKPDKRQKPAPIMHALASPLSTPPSVRVYGRQRTNLDTPSSLPEPPSTPTRYPGPTTPSPRIQTREKRARSVTPQHAVQVKKARIEPAPLASEVHVLPITSTPPPPATPITPEITPQRTGKQLPKLTELLASSKKAKSSPRAGKTMLPTRIARMSEPPAPAAEPPLQPGPSIDLVTETEEEVQQAQGQDMDRRSIFSAPDPTDDIYHKLGYDAGLGEEGMSLGYNIGSPAKSLSSLAASDSEDEDDAPDTGFGLGFDAGFEPPFASTQAGKGGDNGGWVGYNSQFDVDGRANLVSRFMEKDIDVDIDGWLRDPSGEAEGVGSQ